MIIAALSTPHGRGAINVIRLSGEGCKKLAAKMFSPFPDKANYLKAGTVSTKYFDDKAMCVFFDAPLVYRRGVGGISLSRRRNDCLRRARTLL